MSDQHSRSNYIEISSSSIIKVIIILLIFLFIYLIRDIILMLFVVLVLISAINPLADWLQNKKIPRWVGVLAIYIFFLAIFSFTIIWLIPPFVKELGLLASDFPDYWKKIMSGLAGLGVYSEEIGFQENVQSGLMSLSSTLGAAVSGVFSTLSGIFGGIFSFIIILVVTFYMVVEEDALKGILRSIVPAGYQPYLVRLFNRLEKKLGQWLRGQLILCLIIGTMVYVGLLILGVKYALVLGLFAALTEFIPYLGPIIAGILATFIAFSESPILALFVVILYVVIHQLESHIIIPKLMQRVTGLNPVISIIALLIGGKLAGIIGIILAIPITLAISVFIEDVFKNSEEEPKASK